MFEDEENVKVKFLKDAFGYVHYKNDFPDGFVAFKKGTVVKCHAVDLSDLLGAINLARLIIRDCNQSDAQDNVYIYGLDASDIELIPWDPKEPL